MAQTALQVLIAALSPLTGKVSDLAVAELQNNKAAILAKLQAGEIKLIDVIGAGIESQIPAGGIKSVIYGAVSKAIANLENEAIQAVPGVNELAWNAIIEFAQAEATKLGG